MWTVYIVECDDGTYYTGLTEDLEERVRKHNSGKGSKYTKLKKPITLVYFEGSLTKAQAFKREIEIKKLSHSKKKHLIRFGKGVSLAAKN